MMIYLHMIRTKMMLTKHKEINAIFIVAAGVYGACRAVLSLKKTE